MRHLSDTQTLVELLDSLEPIDPEEIIRSATSRYALLKRLHNSDRLYLFTCMADSDGDSVKAEALSELKREALLYMEQCNRVLFKSRIPLLGCSEQDLAELREKYLSISRLGLMVSNCINPSLDQYAEACFFTG